MSLSIDKYCDPSILDDCFIKNSSTSKHRHYKCVNRVSENKHVCVPQQMEQPRSQIELIIQSEFSMMEKNVLLRLQSYIINLSEKLYLIWKEHTSERTILEEQQLPLASLAILMINRCATNLTGFIMSQEQFKMEPLFVSLFVGWSMYWKQLLQGPADKRVRTYIRSPWAVLLDLSKSINRILKLVSLLRYTRDHIDIMEQIYYESNKWKHNGGETSRTPDREFHIQTMINVLVSILANGRLTENGEKIASSFTIPKYDVSNGYLYMYFSDRYRSMMCQASTTLVATLLSCTFPDDMFGVDLSPGHIFVAYVKNNVYYPIESTMFNTEGYASIGKRFEYHLDIYLPLVKTPYVYIPDESFENNTIEIVRAQMARKSIPELRIMTEVDDVFPYGSKKEYRYDIPLESVQYMDQNTILLKFQKDTTTRLLKLFEFQFILKHMAKKYRMIPVGYSSDKNSIRNPFFNPSIYDYQESFAIQHNTVEKVTTMTFQYPIPFEFRLDLDRIIQNRNGSVYTGTFSRPAATGTNGITSSILFNLVLSITTTPSKKSVRLSNPGSIKTMDQNLIETLNLIENLSVNVTNRGDLVFQLGIGSMDISKHVEESDDFLLRTTDGRSRMTLIEHSNTDSDNVFMNKVHPYPLRMSNIIYDEYTVSEVVSYEWYVCIVSQSLDNSYVRSLFDKFETTSHNCSSCYQKKIHSMGSVLETYFPYLNILSKETNRKRQREE